VRHISRSGDVDSSERSGLTDKCGIGIRQQVKCRFTCASAAEKKDANSSAAQQTKQGSSGHLICSNYRIAAEI
jgi:hypothetical protein